MLSRAKMAVLGNRRRGRDFSLLFSREYGSISAFSFPTSVPVFVIPPSKTFRSRQRAGNEAIYRDIQITLVMPFAAKDPILEKPSEKCKSFMRSPRVFDVYREFPPFLFSNVSLFSLGTVLVPRFALFKQATRDNALSECRTFFALATCFSHLTERGLEDRTL